MAEGRLLCRNKDPGEPITTQWIRGSDLEHVTGGCNSCSGTAQVKGCELFGALMLVFGRLVYPKPDTSIHIQALYTQAHTFSSLSNIFCPSTAHIKKKYVHCFGRRVRRERGTEPATCLHFAPYIQVSSFPP